VQEIKEWEKLLRRIEAGEARVARRLALDACLARKAGAYAEPWNSLKIDYTCLGAAKRPPSPFTLDNDRHLVCMALQVGYGRWDELVREVRRSWLFKFDWYMKTRVGAELGKRVEYLSKLIEKELGDEDAARKEEERKAKKASKAAGKRPMDEEPAGSGKKPRRE
jgi:SWI/SNF-related matrix-associated actin-dependent regulator of chromatin subfamily A member 5